MLAIKPEKNMGDSEEDDGGQQQARQGSGVFEHNATFFYSFKDCQNVNLLLNQHTRSEDSAKKEERKINSKRIRCGLLGSILHLKSGSGELDGRAGIKTATPHRHS